MQFGVPRGPEECGIPVPDGKQEKRRDCSVQPTHSGKGWLQKGRGHSEPVRRICHEHALPHQGRAGGSPSRDVQEAVDNRDGIQGDQGHDGKDVHGQATCAPVSVSFCAVAVQPVVVCEIVTCATADREAEKALRQQISLRPCCI